MSKAFSLDLRQRVVAAVRDERLSHRAAAARFKVSAASISRWRALERQSGHLRPGPLGGDRHSAAIEAHANLILRMFEARRDMSIEELRALSLPGEAFTSVMEHCGASSRGTT